MSKWFIHCSSVEDIKKQYHAYCFKYHPDVSKSDTTAIMQEINEAYLNRLESCNGNTFTDAKGKEHTYWYKETIEKSIMDKLDQLLRARLQNIDILLVGRWLWVTGDTRPVKDRLKAMKLIWHSKRLMWYWKPAGLKSHYSDADFNWLCFKYGCKEIVTPDEKTDLIECKA